MLGTSGGVSIEHLNQIRNLVRTESTTVLKDRWEAKGFSKIDIELITQKSKGVSPALIVQKLSIDTLFPGVSSKLDSETKVILSGILDACKEIVQDDAEEHIGQKFALTYDAGSGKFGLLYLEVRRNAKNEAKWDLLFAQSVGSFEVAPDILIVEKSKKGFLSSKSWFEMVPLKPQLTANKIDDLFAVVFPRIAEWMNRFSPAELGPIK